MASSSVLFILLIFHLVLPHSAASADEEKNIAQLYCPKSFVCGPHRHLKFPYTNTTYPSCGVYTLNCSESVTKLQLGSAEYKVKELSSNERIKVSDQQLRLFKSRNSCEIFAYSITLPNTPSISFTYSPNITLLKCHKLDGQDPYREPYQGPPYQVPDFILRNHSCTNFTVYPYDPPQNEVFPADTPPSIPPFCEFITLPAVDHQSSGGDVFSELADEFTIRFHVSNQCQKCLRKGQQCPLPNFPSSSCVGEVVNVTKASKGSGLPLILGTAVPVGFLLICLFLLGIRYQKKMREFSSYVARTTSSDPSTTLDLEGGNMYFGVPIFSYAELQEATNNFDPSTELGDGGFGTVYLGKIKDGREVAVKRPYERSYKRVSQFQNEIEILTRLRHRNLVSLYGCTSSQSRELLLVYEYIPNGTVADHLHGDRAKDGQLTWPNRMNIAIETASALVYLHASDIIHRDVKTNNILLDKNFCVKVADFGLSRLFPTDKTHVSTAPQGTPGYVDPEYHQCYQLTEKSDVYSFGVVLIELISSMPAVDINRHRHEINLANLALNKIQSGELVDLVDPNLGFGSDASTERMITSVAEVAFRCIQLEKEMRPSMDEVLESLKEIADYKDEKKGVVIDKVGSKRTAWISLSPESDDAILLKNRNASTPDTMTDKWSSGSSTTISSG